MDEWFLEWWNQVLECEAQDGMSWNYEKDKCQEDKKKVENSIDETDRKIKPSSPFSTMSSSKSSSSTKSISRFESRNSQDKPIASFHNDALKSMEKSHHDFFEKSRKQFEENVKEMQKNMEKISKEMKVFDTDYSSKLQNIRFEDNHELKIVNDEDKLEIHLDTVGYKPDELKVLVGDSVVSVEGKHEERTEDGESVMVSRQMKRQYPLPAGAQYDQVNSNLSKDGVLIISVPKSKTIKQQDRHVPIKMN